MAPFIASASGKLLMGLSLGIVFGFAIHKSRMTRYETIVGLLRLRDFTMLKVMLSAIVVGMVGIYFLKDIGILKLSPKPALIGANIIGGLIFGVGFALAGYCPTTGIGSIAEGRYDALLGAIPGMLVGAAIYAEAYTYLRNNLLQWGALGKITIPDVLGFGYPYHWILILVICGAIVVFCSALQKQGL